jgi:hypothetical protein
MDSPPRTIEEAGHIGGCGKHRGRHAAARVTISRDQPPFIMQPAASTTQLATASQNA